MFSLYKKKVSKKKKKKNDMPAGPAATHDCVEYPARQDKPKKILPLHHNIISFGTIYLTRPPPCHQGLVVPAPRAGRIF